MWLQTDTLHRWPTKLPAEMARSPRPSPEIRQSRSRWTGFVKRNLGLAAAAYNAGGGRIEKWLSRRGQLPEETRAYVKIITGNKAEDWATESKTISVPTDLPRHAPCDGVGGLSKSKHNQFAQVSVTLAPSVGEMLRKAEANDAQARQGATRMIIRRTTMARARTSSDFARAEIRDMKIVVAVRMHPLARKKKPVVLASASSR